MAAWLIGIMFTLGYLAAIEKEAGRSFPWWVAAGAMIFWPFFWGN